jgi:hypothetical protein
VSKQRGAMLSNLHGGVIVHDHFKPYFTLVESNMRCATRITCVS